MPDLADAVKLIAETTRSVERVFSMQAKMSITYEQLKRFLFAAERCISHRVRAAIIDPAEADNLLATTNAEEAVMRGRPMRGWLRVAAADLRTAPQLERWVTRGADYAASLPPKPPKS